MLDGLLTSCRMSARFGRDGGGAGTAASLLSSSAITSPGATPCFPLAVYLDLSIVVSLSFPNLGCKVDSVVNVVVECYIKSGGRYAKMYFFAVF